MILLLRAFGVYKLNALANPDGIFLVRRATFLRTFWRVSFMRDALKLEPSALDELNALLPPILPSTLTRHSNPIQAVLVIVVAGVDVGAVGSIIATQLASVVTATPNGTLPTP